MGYEIVLEHGPLMIAGCILLLSGLMMFSTGLIGEMMMRTYFESQDRRIYAVREILTRKQRGVAGGTANVFRARSNRNKSHDYPEICVSRQRLQSVPRRHCSSNSAFIASPSRRDGTPRRSTGRVITGSSSEHAVLPVEHGEFHRQRFGNPYLHPGRNIFRQPLPVLVVKRRRLQQQSSRPHRSSLPASPAFRRADPLHTEAARIPGIQSSPRQAYGGTPPLFVPVP